VNSPWKHSYVRVLTKNAQLKVQLETLTYIFSRWMWHLNMDSLLPVSMAYNTLMHSSPSCKMTFNVCDTTPENERIIQTSCSGTSTLSWWRRDAARASHTTVQAANETLPTTSLSGFCKQKMVQYLQRTK
jgi:hypothetical protein